MNLNRLFLLFMCYSVIGWFIEVIHVFLSDKKLINRGFLIGPYCPIYGLGGVLTAIILTKYKDNVIVLFVMSMFLFAVLEYFTSYLMEKLFKARWWDYSNYRFNLNGRVCLENLILFGLLGCIAVYVTNPCFIWLFSLVSSTTLKTIAIVLFIFFICDLFLSLKIINSFKNTTLCFVKKDNTEELTKKVKEILLSKSVLTKRLIVAFPKFKAVIDSHIKNKKFRKKS